MHIKIFIAICVYSKTFIYLQSESSTLGAVAEQEFINF